jgi:hypothetical protein
VTTSEGLVVTVEGRVKNVVRPVPGLARGHQEIVPGAELGDNADELDR